MSESPEKSIGDLLGGGGIAQLLQNPEIAAKLPRIMEALAPVMAEMKAEKAGAAAAPATAAAPASAEPATGATAEEPVPPAAAADTGNAQAAAAAAVPAMSKKGNAAAHRMALLRALSPYLSAERQSALDTVLKVSALLDLLTEVM